MKTFCLLFFLFLITITSKSQVASTFENFPRHYQVIQRNSENKGKIAIKGTISDESQTDISILITKDDKTYFHKKQKLSFTNNIAEFNQPTELNAELAFYDIFVFAHKGKDSVLIRGAYDVVCGETIILYGQSNILADFDIKNYDFANPYARTLYIDFDSENTNWFIAEKWNNFVTGTIGCELQKKIIETYKIPVGIINGAEGGHSIVELSKKDSTFSENKFTDYGRLLRKMREAQLTNQSKIIIWRQGEREAFDSTLTPTYEATFEKLHKQIFSDFPALQKFYNFQNNMLGIKNPKAGNLRDFQRKTKYIFPKIETLSSIGTTAYDGLHYFNEGYKQTAEELFRLIQRDFFKSTDTTEINPPDIKFAHFTPNRDTLVLVFEEFQKLSYIPSVVNNEDGIIKTYKLKNLVYLDGLPIKSDTGVVQKNVIFFPLKEKSNAKTVSFMPDYWPGLDYKTKFPVIKNSRGLRAFTFKNVSVTINTFIDENPPKPLFNEEIDDNIILFPNPSFSENIVFIKNLNRKKVEKIEIYSINGSKIYEKKQNFEDDILKIEFMNKGVYFLNVFFNENLKIIKKFVVE